MKNPNNTNKGSNNRYRVSYIVSHQQLPIQSHDLLTFMSLYIYIPFAQMLTPLIVSPFAMLAQQLCLMNQIIKLFGKLC